MARLTCCMECGAALPAAKCGEINFCRTPANCRYAWTNRRKLRGAELYDLFMAYRFQRGVSKTLGLWSLICRMASIWNEEDKAAGRKTYKDPQEAKLRAVRYLGVSTWTR